MDTDITAEMADSALDLGLEQAKLGKREAAGNLQTARSLIEELHRADPGNAMYHEELAKTYLFSGKAMEALGQRSAALAFYKKSMGVYQELKPRIRTALKPMQEWKRQSKAFRAFRFPGLLKRRISFPPHR